jgi:hypothetical protein
MAVSISETPEEEDASRAERTALGARQVRRGGNAAEQDQKIEKRPHVHSAF